MDSARLHGVLRPGSAVVESSSSSSASLTVWTLAEINASKATPPLVRR